MYKRQAFAQKMNIEHKGDTTIIKVENPTKYLLLPIQEEKDEAQVLLDTGSDVYKRQLYDRKTNSDKYTAFIGCNNYTIGKSMGTFIAQMCIRDSLLPLPILH